MKHDSQLGSGLDLIIDLSKSRTVWIRLLEAAATMGMWWLWLYLMLPFTDMLLSWMGLPGGYGQWLGINERQDLLAFLGNCAAVFAGIILGVMGWGYGNYLAFLRRGRNPSRPPISDEELARSWGVKVSELEGCRRAQTMVVTHDERGRIKGVICLGRGEWDSMIVNAYAPSSGPGIFAPRDDLRAMRVVEPHPILLASAGPAGREGLSQADG